MFGPRLRLTFGAVAVLVTVVVGSAVMRRVGGEPTPSVRASNSGVAAVPGWQEVAVVPEKRSPSAVVVADGRIMLWGGATHAEGAQMYDAPEGYSGYPPGYQGFFGDPRVDGAIFELGTGEWLPIPDAPVRFLDWDVFSAWTGTELLVWGNEYVFPGQPPPASAGPVGALYDPHTSQWRVMAGQEHVLHGEAVWTGDRLVVAGAGVDHKLHAASYDPARDEWRVLPIPPLRNIESLHALNDDSVLVASDAAVAVLVDGADAWRPTAVSPFANRSLTSFAWTGKELIQHGGGLASGDAVPPQGGGVSYDPQSDSWRSLNGAPPTSWGAPGPPGEAVAAGGGDVFFLGGRTRLWRHSSATDAWTALPGPQDPLLMAVVSQNDLWALTRRSTPPGGVLADVSLVRLPRR